MSEGDEPAFPVSWEEGGSMVADPGMTLRDYFAGRALEGLMERDELDSHEKAGIAYMTADAMLEERGGE